MEMKGKSKRARGGYNMVGDLLSHIWSLQHPIRAKWDAPLQTCENKGKWEVAEGKHEQAVREQGRASTKQGEHRGSTWPKRALAGEQSGKT